MAQGMRTRTTYRLNVSAVALASCAEIMAATIAATSMRGTCCRRTLRQISSEHVPLAQIPMVMVEALVQSTNLEH